MSFFSFSFIFALVCQYSFSAFYFLALAWHFLVSAAFSLIVLFSNVLRSTSRYFLAHFFVFSGLALFSFLCQYLLVDIVSLLTPCSAQ